MVELDFDPNFDIEPKYGASECRYDFVEIRQRYGSSDEEVLGRFCGLVAPQFAPLESPVYIEFLSDDRITGYGWTVEFEVGKYRHNTMKTSYSRTSLPSITYNVSVLNTRRTNFKEKTPHLLRLTANPPPPPTPTTFHSEGLS